MDLRLALRGFVIGFALAAPIGPIGVLVIRRSLADGVLSGLATGLGAAVADAIFALAGALGFASFATGLGSHAWTLRAAGGLMLVGLGLRAMTERRGASVVARVAHGKAFFGTLLLTLTSPISILSFAAVAASLGVGAGAWGDAVALVCGVFIGSALWWTVLSGGVSVVRRRLPDRALVWINRGSGVALAVFGAMAIALP